MPPMVRGGGGRPSNRAAEAARHTGRRRPARRGGGGRPPDRGRAVSPAETAARMPGMGAEVAHHYRHPALPDVDLLRARFVTHRFSRHTHDGYVFAVIEAGVEEFEHGDGVERAGAGSVVGVNPGVVPGGNAGAPEGWAYRVLYPPVDVVAGVAADLAVRPGVPVFPEPVLDDPAAARVLRAVHRAGEK